MAGDPDRHGLSERAFASLRREGTLRSTLFEQPGELVCAMNPAALLETADGATVRLEGRGYARRDKADDHRWRVAATLRFDSDDQRYAWLDRRLGIWEGEFDAQAHRARYRGYAAQRLAKPIRPAGRRISIFEYEGGG